MIRWQFKLQFTVTEFHLILALILSIHVSLMALKSSEGSYIVTQEEIELEKKKKLAKKSKTEELEEGIAGGVYKRKPFVITYLGNIQQKRHSELLALLQNKFHKGPAKVSSLKTGVEVAQAEAVEIESDLSQDFEITDEQKKNLIKRLIKERMQGVNVCKQKHLLEDEFLMGTLKVNMKIKAPSNVALPKFAGHGNRKVISSLENCIRAELASISFPSELNNQEVSFDLKIN